MADVGTAVATGDIITAAKMNLKLETTADRAALGVVDQSGVGSYATNIIVAETLTADRNLTIAVDNAARSVTISGDLDFGGDFTTANAFTTSGAFALTLTVTNTTNATLPAGTVTLMDLSTAQTVTGAKRFADDAILIENPATTFYYTLTGAAIAANRILNLPLLTGTDTLVTAAFIQTLTNKTLTAPTINGGTATALTGLAIRSTGAAFDLTFASSEVLTAGRTLSITVGNAARAVSMAGDVTIGGALTTGAAFTTTPANAVTLTTTGATNVTLPNAGTLAILGANSFTAAQTLVGSVDTVLNIATSPIIDIGADVFATGTFIDIAYDTAETLTGALIGIAMDLDTNVTLSGQNIRGLSITMPATYGAGAEYGIYMTGDGQTIAIGQDADLYISLADATGVGINLAGVSPVVALAAVELATGYFLAVNYDAAETTTGDVYVLDVFRTANALTLGADLYGVNLDFNTNVVSADDRDVRGFRVTTPAHTLGSAVTTNIIGLDIPTAGALVSNFGASTLNWRGVNIQMPNITQTLGTMSAIGILLTEGTTTSGTCNAISINGSVDTIINFTASPIIDVGADVFTTGTFAEFAFDSIQTLTAALTGVKVDWDTVIVTTGGAATGNITPFWADLGQLAVAGAYNAVIYGFRGDIDFTVGAAATVYGIGLTMPATFTATTYGIHVTGDGQTINIVNDVDAYIAMSKANLVNISLQAVTPVVDIGATVFTTGTFIDIAYDAAETLTAALTGVLINWDTQVVTTGGAATGNITAYWADMGNLSVNGAYNATIYGLRLDMDFTVGGAETIHGISVTLPATFGAGTEIGAHIGGDGQTVDLVTDTVAVDVGASVFQTGSFITVDFDAAETTTGALYVMEVFNTANALTLGGDLYGIQLDFSTSVVNVTDQDVRGYQVIFAALTQTPANTTRFYGFDLPTAGAMVQTTNAGVLDWRGVNIQLPNTTQTTGTVTAYGVYITEGTTTSGAVAGLYIDVDVAIDLVTLGNRIDLDADNDTSIRASADDVITIETLGADSIALDGVNFVVDLAVDGTNAWRIDLDVDNDTSIRCSADDVIDIEITGTDLIRITFDTGAATGLIKAASAVEIGFCVTNAALTVGSSGSVVIPIAAVINDAVAGNVDGAIAIDTDTSIEVRTGGAWLTAAIAGYVIQCYAPWVESGQGWYHPNMFWVGEKNDHGYQMIDETVCPVCGEPIEPGDLESSRAVVMYPNAYSQPTKKHGGRQNVHAIFGHAHIEREPVFSSLQDRVEAVEEALELLRTQVKELDAVPVA